MDRDRSLRCLIFMTPTVGWVGFDVIHLPNHGVSQIWFPQESYFLENFKRVFTVQLHICLNKCNKFKCISEYYV